MKRGFSNVYQFKVTLQDIHPPIWRRIHVPESYSFWALHVAIQDVMGWLDYHLHEFEIENPATGVRERIGIPGDEFDSDIEWLPGWELQIADYFSPENPTARYAYDFGDDWEHTITLEQVLPRAANVRYPRCLAGARACPPEDVGGVWGYGDFQQIIGDLQHEEHESTLVWVGGSFDPERFRPEEVRFDDPDVRWRRAFQDERGCPAAIDLKRKVTMTLTLTSSAFAQGGEIPAEYTCDGGDLSPPLAWNGIPAGTRSTSASLSAGSGAHRGRPRRARPQGAQDDLGALGALHHPAGGEQPAARYDRREPSSRNQAGPQ